MVVGSQPVLRTRAAELGTAAVEREAVELATFRGFSRVRGQPETLTPTRPYALGP